MHLFHVFLILILSGCVSQEYVFKKAPSESAEFNIVDSMQYLSYYAVTESNGIEEAVKRKYGNISNDTASNEEILQHVSSVNNAIHNQFNYKKDGDDDLNSWSIGTEVLLADDTFEGDCEDLALTTIEVLIDTGIPREKLFKFLTRSGGNKTKVNHMVAGFEDKTGQIWIIGDTFNSNIRKLEHVRNDHIIDKYSRVSWASVYVTL